jgi:secreted Zn-dependent insulinase-like peptidase
VSYYNILVQSSNYHPTYLHGRIEAFIEYYYNSHLLQMTTEKFNQYKQALVNTLLKKPLSMAEEGDQMRRNAGSPS